MDRVEQCTGRWRPLPRGGYTPAAVAALEADKTEPVLKSVDEADPPGRAPTPHESALAAMPPRQRRVAAPSFDSPEYRSVGPGDPMGRPPLPGELAELTKHCGRGRGTYPRKGKEVAKTAGQERP
jgi:hypothetical protein